MGFLDGDLTRRDSVKRVAFGLSTLGFGPFVKADEPGLILRNSRPLDLETPVTALSPRLTPNDKFFIRSHLSTPAIGLEPWLLHVGGQVERRKSWSIEELERLEQVTIPAVLQCAGNGRAYFRPRVPGVQWDRGAVGHAEWSGVRLIDLLDRAGYKSTSQHVHLLGADAPPSPKTPRYLRSLPLEKALSPSTIVALRMNGAPLPYPHGGPLRLIVPGWTGNHWMKWLRQVVLSDVEAPGTYQQAGYKMPRSPAPPGAILQPSDMVSLTYMNVKSLITSPGEGATLKVGPQRVQGVAWTGAGHVTKLEVAFGAQGPWRPAELEGETTEGSWRTWSIQWSPERAGVYSIRARATDSHGETQPDVTPWNKSGYLWNGIDRVTCEVS